jgi:hypothetical protein
MSKFIVNPKEDGGDISLSILNSKGESQLLVVNKEYNVADFSSNDLLFFSSNGKKNKKGEWEYLPSITFLDATLELKPDVPAVDIAESIKAGQVVNKEIKKETK